MRHLNLRYVRHFCGERGGGRQETRLSLSPVVGDDVFAVRQGRERETPVTAGPLCVSWLEGVTTSSNATLISCVA